MGLDMFVLLCLQFVTLVGLVPFTAAVEDCSLIINEIQLEALNAPVEFIELRKNCSGPLNLASFTMILWHGSPGKEGVNKLEHRAVFSSASDDACKVMNSTFLVLGGNEARKVIDNTTQFCHFDSFNDEWKHPPNAATLDKKNTNALTLYRNLDPAVVKTLVINTSLTDSTGYRDNIVDVVFFTGRNKGGGGATIKHLLFPEYQVGPSEINIYYRISDADEGNVTAEHRRSFSYCCNQSSVGGKWPMAFKYARPSPSAENNCSDPAEYALDGKGTTFNLSTDRCNVQAMENYFPKPSPTSTVPTVTTTTAGTAPVLPDAAHEVRVVGLAVGIPLAMVILALVGYILVDRRRRMLEKKVTDSC